MAKKFQALNWDQFVVERDRLSKREPGDYPGLTLVRFLKSHDTMSGQQAWSDEVNDWLGNEDRPGGYDMLSAIIGFRPAVYEHFAWFTDADLAFEFSMRWR